jgi:hypothetical protein
VDSSDAAYYQAHKDEVDEWGVAENPPAPAKRLDVVVSVRFSAAEEAMLRRASAKRGQTLSTFIRKCALDECRTGVPTVMSLSYQTAPKTGSASFGGQIAFPGGTLQLAGRPIAAEPSLPMS